MREQWIVLYRSAHDHLRFVWAQSGDGPQVFESRDAANEYVGLHPYLSLIECEIQIVKVDI